MRWAIPLLASLGKAGREFALLLAGMEGEEAECYQEPAATSMLGMLQHDILELENHDPAGGGQSDRRRR